MLARYRYWLPLVVLPVALVLAWLQVLDLRDPSIRLQIVREAGSGYVIQSYVAMTLALTLPVIGAIMKRRKIV